MASVPSSQAPSPTAGTSAGASQSATITIGETDCSSDVAEKLDRGLIRLTVVNTTEGIRAAGIWRIADDHSFDDVEAAVDEEQSRAAEGEPSGGHPSFLAEGEGTTVNGTATVSISEDLREGTYVILCAESRDGQLFAFQALGPWEARAP